MIILTARAGALLHRLQSARAGPHPPRLVSANNGYTIELSIAVPTDQALCHAGTPVLYISAEAVTALDGCILTARDLPEGPVLVIMPMPDVAAGGRTLHVGGRARRSPAIMPLPSPEQYGKLRAHARRLVTNDIERGVPSSSRAYCDACQQPRPASGSAQHGRYALCNDCVLEFGIAGASGAAVSAGQFVRDKVFGDTLAYGMPPLPSAKTHGSPALLQLGPRTTAYREQETQGGGGPPPATRRPVLRLPRPRAL